MVLVTAKVFCRRGTKRDFLDLEKLSPKSRKKVEKFNKDWIEFNKRVSFPLKSRYGFESWHEVIDMLNRNQQWGGTEFDCEDVIEILHPMRKLYRGRPDLSLDRYIRAIYRNILRNILQCDEFGSNMNCNRNSHWEAIDLLGYDPALFWEEDPDWEEDLDDD